MKKKIIAALLTLCMVVSLLPLSALAAAWKATFNNEEITLNVAEDGTVSSSPDKSTYYTFEKVTDQDKFTYYEIATGERGELTATPVTAAVEAPVFTPAAGEVEAGAEVAITCATEGAAIYYTTDGTEPTSSSTAYSSAITIGEAVTIKAIAIKDGVSSEIVTAAYTVAAPKCTCTTKCTADTKDAECPVCNAADADLDAVCTGAAVESNVITAGADTSGSTITVNTEVLADSTKVGQMIEDAKSTGDETQGSIVVDATASVTDAQKPVDVNLPEELLTAVKNDSVVSTVTVKVANVSLNLPVAGLQNTSADAKLTIQTKAATGSSLGSIDLKLNGSSATFTIPVTVELKIGITTPGTKTGAFWNVARNCWERVRSTVSASGCKFFTRHFSEFAVVENADAQAAELNVIKNTNNKVNDYSFKMEPDECLIYIIHDADGYTYTTLKLNGKEGDALVDGGFNTPKDVEGIYTAVGAKPGTKADGTLDFDTTNAMNRWTPAAPDAGE